jgi:nicotinate phosphoribosyltransferase
MQKIDLYNCKDYEVEDFLGLRNELNKLWIPMFSEIEVHALHEGSEVKSMEPVIGIIGNPKYFAHLETPTLGILAQQSAVATSVRRAVNALGPDRNLMFFPARFRHYVSQAPDGYACSIGGVNLMSTDANGEYWGYDGIGTIPHLLIAAYKGNTVEAALKFDEIIDPNINRIVLVDWDNDCIGTSLKCVASMLIKEKYGNVYSSHPFSDLLVCKQFLRDNRHHVDEVIGSGKGKLFGVRFDTSGSLIDESLPKSKENFGVCPQLVFEARKTFDDLGLKNLKIIVSGGFDQEKIEFFNKFNAPYDMIGIGSSIVNKFTVDYTADAVMLNGKPNAKVGRELKNWNRMNIVTFV